MRKMIVGAALLLAVLLIALVVQRQVTRTSERGAAGAEPSRPAESPPIGALPDLPPGAGALGDTAILPPSTPESAPAAPPPAGTTPPGTARPAEPRPTAPSPAAPSGDASRILQQAADTYAGVRTLQAEFTMRTENPLLRTSVTSHGRLYQSRPDRIALRFTDPGGDVIVGDGQHIWVYYPSVDERQVIRSPAGTGGAGGVDLQAQFLGDPVQRFEHTLHGTETVRGREAHLLTLVPREPLGYAQLRIWIDARDRLVRRFEITEQNGAVRLVELDNLRTNIAVPDDVFRFTPPANARIVDRG